MDSNVADLLRRAAAAEPHRIALSEASTGRTVTWAELDVLADRIVAGLDTAGLVPGNRVVLAMANRIELVATYLGVLRGRLVAVPANNRSPTGELLRVVADSGARLVVADESCVGRVREAAAAVAEVLRAHGPAAPPPRVVVVGTAPEPGELEYADLAAERPADHAADPGELATDVADPGATGLADAQDPELLAVLLYTSGTSGVPRAAMLSHRALLANVEQVASVDPPMVLPGDVVLGVLPLFHVYGLAAVLGQTIRQQARLVLVDGFEPEGTLDIVEDEAVSVLPVAPPVFAHWMRIPGLEERLGPVRLLLSGSAPLSAELVRAFAERTGVAVHQGYGLTEAAPVVTSTLCSTDPPAGSVGAPLPGVQVRLLDADGHEPDAEDGGEIWIRGENLFSGYWPDGADGPDADGWWPTGDMGYLDASGDLVLVDRLKDLVIVSGFNVYPSEVEDVITELDEVAQAAVIGLADERTGEAVVAYVRPSPTATPETLEDLITRHCEARLAGFKRPSVVHVVDALPRGVTGSVQKGRLREAARRRSLGLLE